MKLKVAEILGANEALAQLGEIDLPISTSVKVARLRKIVGDEANIHLGLRQDLFKKHGKPNKDNQIEVPKANMEAFMKELNELLVQEVEVDWPKIKLPDDEYCKEKGLNIKPNVLTALLELIEENK